MRYAADQHPPHLLAAGLGAQKVALILSGIVLTPVIVLRAGGASALEVSWAIFIALLASGVTTVLQARPWGRLGAGYLLFMGTSGAFISVGIDAIKSGGIPLLCTLIIISSLAQFLMAGHLGALRRLVTPTVGGTTIMLIAVTVMPIAFDLLEQVPDGVREHAPLVPMASGVSTFAITVLLAFFGTRTWRLWSPLIGLVAGMGIAIPGGLVDTAALMRASWIGLPEFAWPAYDLQFDGDFWGLIPAFIIVTLVGAIETYGDGIAIQKVSWRTPRAVDYRAVQGALYCDALGNLLSGLGGTLPNTTYSSSISTVEITGVAARRVGIYGGLVMLAIAFLPKLSALLLTVPGPVVGAYLAVVMVILFMHGLQVAMEEGFTFDRALIVGLSLWLGIGFQGREIYHDLIPSSLVSLLDNGMTAGTIVALLLTSLLQLKGGRTRRLEVPLAMASLGEIQRFARTQADALGWETNEVGRLELAMEEALSVMLEHAGADSAGRRVQLRCRTQLGGLEVEFASAPLGTHLEDLRVDLDPQPAAVEQDLALRILASMADEVRHEQYHGIDFLLLRIAPRTGMRGEVP